MTELTEFAIEADIDDQGSSGIATETIAEKLDASDTPFRVVRFPHENAVRIIHTDPNQADYVVEGTLGFVANTEPEDVACQVGDAIANTPISIVTPWETQQYHIVSEVDDDE